MANLRGKGAFSGVNLIVHSPQNGVVVKDGVEKGRYLDIQVDQSLLNPDKVKSGEKQADSNPHLSSVKKENPKTNTEYVSHREFYSASQYQQMLNASGKKNKSLENGDTVLGIKADLMKNSKGQLVVNTSKEMTATENPKFGKNVLDKQGAVTAAAKEARAASLAAGKSAPAPEATKEADKEPEVG